ncbi:hypothetical protein J3459_013650 [Metarhizium acridum]|nr:hypothetical protein J3459_013650 [Metarhizium acridum]
MYSAQPNSADSATINPAALSSPALSNPPLRGLKRSRSSDSHNILQPGDDGMSWQGFTQLDVCLVLPGVRCARRAAVRHNPFSEAQYGRVTIRKRPRSGRRRSDDEKTGVLCSRFAHFYFFIIWRFAARYRRRVRG